MENSIDCLARDRFVSPRSYAAQLEERVYSAEIGALTKKTAAALSARLAEIEKFSPSVRTMTLDQMSQDLAFIQAGVINPEKSKLVWDSGSCNRVARDGSVPLAR